MNISLKFLKNKALFILLALIILVKACKIAGQQIGVCKPNSVLASSSFCGSILATTICVPQSRVNWDYDLHYRDQIVQKIFITNIEDRLLKQYKYSSNSTSILAISNNIACFDAYKSFLCQWNFPPCNDQLLSQPICKSHCVTFFSECKSSTEVCDIIYAKLSPGLSDC